mgnify:CR=1 FL=1
MAGSNYEVNIQLNVKKINQQLNNLERRIKKLNDIAMGQKGVGKAALKTERDKLALATKTFRREQQITREKAKQNKIEKDSAKTQKAVIPRHSGAAMGPSSPLKFTNQGTLLPGNPIRKPPAFTSGDISGALISGAFPLLFGQGPLGAAAGFGGGLLGSKLGGQTGGFAGGLIATGLLTQIQQISQGLTELGKSMDMFGFNVTTVSKALGVSGTPTEEYLKVLERTQGKQAAFNESMKRMEELVGKDGVEALRKFAEGTQNLQNSISRFLTEIGAKAAKLFGGGSGRAVGLSRSQLLADAEKSDDQEIINLIASKGTNRNKNQRIDDKIVKRMQELNINKKNLDIDATRAMKLGEMTKSVTDRNLLMQETLQFGSEEAGIREKLRELDKQAEKSGIKILDTEREQYENALRLQPQLERIANLYQSIGSTIESGIVDAIEGAIQGTKTLGEVARSVFSQIQRSLIQFGVSTFLAGLPGDFGKFFKANGGPVKGGQSYVVGEKGPEMFTPGVSGTITPNHALGGSTTVVVNVDASGSSVEGDETQGRELGRVISAAIQSEILQQKRPGGLLA